jgi:hypothetical protein
MNEYEATELAYKNGYEAGVRAMEGRIKKYYKTLPGKTMTASVEYCIGLFASELIESKIGKASEKA